MADLKPPIHGGYSLWFLAQEPEQQILQSFVDELADTYGVRRYIAHATLLFLPEKTKEDLEVVTQFCQDIAASYEDLRTEIIGVGMRQMHFQSVFMPVAPSAELMNMNARARKVFGHESDPPYIPHWSAVYGDLEQSMKKLIAADIMTKLEFPTIIPLRSLVLVDANGYPDDWHIVQKFPFGS